jgi:hypothetical protein
MATQEEHLTANRSMKDIVAQALHEAPRPNHDVIRELEIGAVVLGAGTVATVDGLAHLVRTNHDIIARVTQAYSDYAEMTGSNDTISFITRSYSQPDTTLRSGVVKGTLAETNGLLYTQLTESGLDNQPGIQPEALAAADRLFDIAETNPSLKAGLHFVAARSWRSEVGREGREMAEVIAHQDLNVHHLTEEDVLHATHIDQLANIPAAHGLAKLTSALAQTGVNAIPLGPTLQRQANRIRGAFSGSVIEAQQYIGVVTSNVLRSRFGDIELSSDDPTSIEYALWGMKVMTPDTTVIPDSVDLGQLRRAVATRYALRNAEQLCNPNNTDQYDQEIRTYMGIAAALDWNQDAERSLTKTYEAQHKPATPVPAEQPSA